MHDVALFLAHVLPPDAPVRQRLPKATIRDRQEPVLDSQSSHLGESK
jgi:hypothetical protein